jgi:hypothetical protein
MTRFPIRWSDRQLIAIIVHLLNSDFGGVKIVSPGTQAGVAELPSRAFRIECNVISLAALELFSSRSISSSSSPLQVITKMNSPTISPVPGASNTPIAELKSPLSSLEIAIGRGTTLAQVVGAVFGLAALAAFLYGLLYWWRAFINSKYEPFSSLKRRVLTSTCRYARVANAEQRQPANLDAAPSSSSRPDT